ncbi:MAG: hotdog family protein [Pseudomonas sp.]|jgi:predicted hotdog family 3-hydroxylacyl-ACP dehydratase|nr:hotdog family protein [Pseudomonas sp.]
MLSWPLAELLPHAGDMILLDSIERCDEERIVTHLQVRSGGLFNQADGSYPAWLGVELMAQSIAAYAGVRAKRRGDKIELGFLLGTRKYQCNVARFPLGAQLQIEAICSLEDDSGMGVFECYLRGADIYVEARLNVYRPPNVASYFQEPQP